MGEEGNSRRRRLKQDSSDEDGQSSTHSKISEKCELPVNAKRNKKEKSSDEDDNSDEEFSEAEESDNKFEPEEDERWKGQKSKKGKDKHKEDSKIDTGSKDQKGTGPGRRKGRSTNVDGEFEMEVVRSKKRATKVRVIFRSTLYPNRVLGLGINTYTHT